MAGFGLSPRPADAAAGPWWQSDHARVRLVAASDAVGNAKTLRFGLHFTLLRGWKIYWRSPGDAGYPPRPDWAGSENVAAATLEWPAPQRFSVLGFETMGYKDAVVLPLAVVPFEPGKAVRLRGKVPFLACEEICVPYEATVALDLPAGGETTARESGLIERYAARVPMPVAGAGPHLAAFIDGPPGDQVVRVEVRPATALKRPDLFVEGPTGFRFGVPRVEPARGDGPATLTTQASPPPAKQGAAADLTGRTLTLTLVYDGGAVEQSVAAAKGRAFAPRPPEPFSWSTLATVLALALAGGLILNLMPCVLPVLSIKLLSVVGHGGGETATVRRSFLASAAGIVASFLVLGTAAVALKAAGLAAGWGIQFQQPVFLIVMALLLVLFAANLWGLFEFRLPGAVADVAAGSGHGKGMGAHFATGAFATLLATPCSAPFLGTAVGFALARGPAEIYAVFAALGLGLSAPYLLVAAVPRLATRLPRPGHWMITIRRILGVALAATALWLVTVLHAQAGAAAALLAGSALLLVPVALAARRMMPARARGAGWVSVGILAALALAGPAALPVERATPVAVAAATGGAVRWVAFAPDAIAGHIAAGRTVFVDVTADWCITCQVNKALVIDKDPVRTRLNGDRVVAMRADWTRPDPVIAAFLRRYSRFGIPFNVVFGPGTPGGRILPELLTREAVTAALDVASGSPRLAGQ
jgi:suppressor for copper-sensitivity B